MRITALELAVTYKPSAGRFQQANHHADALPLFVDSLGENLPELCLRWDRDISKRGVAS
jgi:hypothetical protein